MASRQERLNKTKQEAKNLIVSEFFEGLKCEKVNHGEFDLAFGSEFLKNFSNEMDKFKNKNNWIINGKR